MCKEFYVTRPCGGPLNHVARRWASRELGASGFPGGDAEGAHRDRFGVLVDRDGRGAAGPDGVLLHGEAPFCRSPRRTAAGLHGGTQRTPTAHGRTAQWLLSIIGSADAGHIVYEGAMPSFVTVSGGIPRTPAILGCILKYRIRDFSAYARAKRIIWVYVCAPNVDALHEPNTPLLVRCFRAEQKQCFWFLVTLRFRQIAVPVFA